MLVSTCLLGQAHFCSFVLVGLAPSGSVAPSAPGSHRDEPTVAVVELAPRPVRVVQDSPQPIADESVLETTDDAPELGPAASMPFKLSVLGMASYQTLDGSSGAGRLSDSAVGYLDVVIESELWDGATALVEWESIGGDGPDRDLATFGGGGGLFGWNANAGSAQDPDGFDRVYLAEAFVSVGNLCENWVLDIGKIASTSYIDTLRVANDSVGQFMSGAFSNASAFQAPFRGGGVAVTYVGDERFDFRALAMRPDNSGDDAANRAFGAAQFGVYWGQSSQPGSCALYGWSNGSEDDQVGVGLAADQDFGARITALGRLTFQEVDSDPTLDDLHRSWSCGFELREGFTARESDLFALAVGQNVSHDDGLEPETVFETYYKRVFNPHCEGSLHIQSIEHASGNDAVDWVTGLGARIVFMF